MSPRVGSCLTSSRRTRHSGYAQPRLRSGGIVPPGNSRRAQIECERVPVLRRAGPFPGGSSQTETARRGFVGAGDGRRSISDVDRAGPGPASAHGRVEPLEGAASPRQRSSATELERTAESSRRPEEPRGRGRHRSEHPTALLRAVAPALAHVLRQVERSQKPGRRRPARGERFEAHKPATLERPRALPHAVPT
jgi:hypothetical protein